MVAKGHSIEHGRKDGVQSMEYEEWSTEYGNTKNIELMFLELLP